MLKLRARTIVVDAVLLRACVAIWMSRL